MIDLQITAQGGVRMLHDDAVDLSQYGEISVSRASHVEFALGLETGPQRGWYVQSAKTMKILAYGFQTRAEALAWEKYWYSPSGPGWTELTQEVK